MSIPTIGSFVPETNVWDTQQLLAADVDSPEFKELLIRLYQNINLIAINLNIKDIGYYSTFQYNCGQNFFPNPANNSQTSAQSTFRPVIRLVVNFGALPNSTSKSVAHGIIFNSSVTFTRIYATATDTTGLTAIDLSQTGAIILITSTDVTITTSSNLSNYNVTYVVLEYIIN